MSETNDKQNRDGDQPTALERAYHYLHVVQQECGLIPGHGWDRLERAESDLIEAARAEGWTDGYGACAEEQAKGRAAAANDRPIRAEEPRTCATCAHFQFSDPAVGYQYGHLCGLKDLRVPVRLIYELGCGKHEHIRRAEANDEEGK